MHTLPHVGSLYVPHALQSTETSACSSVPHQFPHLCTQLLQPLPPHARYRKHRQLRLRPAWQVLIRYLVNLIKRCRCKRSSLDHLHTAAQHTATVHQRAETRVCKRRHKPTAAQSTPLLAWPLHRSCWPPRPQGSPAAVHHSAPAPCAAAPAGGQAATAALLAQTASPKGPVRTAARGCAGCGAKRRGPGPCARF